MNAILFYSFVLLTSVHSQNFAIDGKGNIFETISVQSTDPAILPSTPIPLMTQNDVIAVTVIALACILCAFLCSALAAYMCKLYAKVKKQIDH